MLKQFKLNILTLLSCEIMQSRQMTAIFTDCDPQFFLEDYIGMPSAVYELILWNFLVWWYVFPGFKATVLWESQKLLQQLSLTVLSGVGWNLVHFGDCWSVLILSCLISIQGKEFCICDFIKRKKRKWKISFCRVVWQLQTDFFQIWCDDRYHSALSLIPAWIFLIFISTSYFLWQSKI